MEIFAEHLKDAKIQHFNDDKRAELILNILNLATQTALKLEETQLLVEQKRYHRAETLKSLIQADSILEGVRTNAKINRGNAYVGFLGVVGNAAEGSAIGAHTANCLSAINEIDSNLSGYEDLIALLKNQLKEE